MYVNLVNNCNNYLTVSSYDTINENIINSFSIKNLINWGFTSNQEKEWIKFNFLNVNYLRNVSFEYDGDFENYDIEISADNFTWKKLFSKYEEEYSIYIYYNTYSNNFLIKLGDTYLAQFEIYDLLNTKTNNFNKFYYEQNGINEMKIFINDIEVCTIAYNNGKLDLYKKDVQRTLNYYIIPNVINNGTILTINKINSYNEFVFNDLEFTFIKINFYNISSNFLLKTVNVNGLLDFDYDKIIQYRYTNMVPGSLLEKYPLIPEYIEKYLEMLQGNEALVPVVTDGYNLNIAYTSNISETGLGSINTTYINNNPIDEDETIYYG